ncbi:hypothetical protein NDU88_003256 [Pleurodeles waltl]|uniref:Uncharacterized protein n=1 Tax=Pleurodeles waltl TaxID=8319 RepID=A0AAV7MQN8_PLEWA|nr:hypothetical protein NDU88_003256 [Pleurodeles waltl]
MRRSRRFPAGSRPCSRSYHLRPCPAQLRATRYSDIRHPMSDVPAVLPLSAPLTAISSSVFVSLVALIF